MEMRCYRKMLRISYKDHVTNEEVCAKIQQAIGPHVERLDKASTAYGMKINAEKTTLMINNTIGINKEIKVNGQKLESVTSLKYRGSVVSDDGSKPEILSRLAQTTAALTRLKPVWNDRSISLTSKTRLTPCHIHLPVCL